LGDFGNWSIEKCVYDYILKILPKGKHILELGSGEGSTKNLSKYYKVTSVEHDLEWVGIYPNVNYIHAPIKAHKPVKKFDDAQWYDSTILKEKLPKEYDLLLVDGPPSSFGRSGLIKYWFDLFRQDTPIIFDDCNRYDDWRIACKIATRLKSPLVVFSFIGEKTFAYCDPNNKFDFTKEI